MARLSRLVVPGHAHLVIQRGHSAQPVFADAHDRAAFMAALREASTAERVAVHAWALPETEVQLLATPAEAPALGRMMQALGRRYVAAYNRRHARSGTLWDGRFRCAVIGPGPMRLAALQFVDGHSDAAGMTSADQRTGGPRDSWLVDPPEVWALGNTPFEREAAYRTRLAQGQPLSIELALRRAALGGWAAGSEDFLLGVAESTDRPTRPRARGRPRKS
jgi:REP-associated tyrosine transposase